MLFWLARLWQWTVLIGLHLACTHIRIALVDIGVKDIGALLCLSPPFARGLICYRVKCGALVKLHQNY